MLYTAAWGKTKALTLRRFRLLMEYFHSLEAAWKYAHEAELINARFDPQSVEAIVNGKKGMSPDQALEELAQIDARILHYFEGGYPLLLKEIPDAPPFLYARGRAEAFNVPCIAIVGTRKMSDYGKRITEEWTRYLVSQGFCIVSGLAFGVDRVAHQTVVENEGSTIAVLGSGIDRIFPREHVSLGISIVKQGMLVSELPPREPPFKYNFPRRNRIISGLSVATLVMEAGKKSGALITAELALSQNRDVFSVPGSIFSPQSAGTNGLIAKGEAKLVSKPEEILEELKWHIKSPVEKEAEAAIILSCDEKKILSCLDGMAKPFDMILRKSEMHTQKATSLLTLMEMKGVVKHVGQGQWVRK